VIWGRIASFSSVVGSLLMVTARAPSSPIHELIYASGDLPARIFKQAKNRLASGSTSQPDGSTSRRAILDRVADQIEIMLSK
jgi:hypothetical protein